MELILMVLLSVMVIGTTLSTIWFLLVDDKSEYNAIYLGLLALFIAPYLLIGAFVRYFRTHGTSDTLDKISGDIVFWTIGAVTVCIIGLGLAFLIIYTTSDDKPIKDKIREHRTEKKEQKTKTQKPKAKPKGRIAPKKKVENR